jgi:nicotinamidase-related amidase
MRKPGRALATAESSPLRCVRLSDTNPMNTALLFIDFINLLPGNPAPLGARAVRAARNAAILKKKAKRSGVPVIYANDHFGDWRSDFPSLVQTCHERPGHPQKLARIMCPDRDDYTVLKPMHSAFYGTPLEFLLDELGVRRLILAGLEADICVLATAQDAYMRKFDLWIPSNCVASRSVQRMKGALALFRHNLKASTRSVYGGLKLSAGFA